jgi:hypothetical protein
MVHNANENGPLVRAASEIKSLDGELSELTASLSRPQGGVAVFRDDHLLGFVIAGQHGFDAITADGTALVKFNTEGAAARAILAAWYSL